MNTIDSVTLPISDVKSACIRYKSAAEKSRTELREGMIADVMSRKMWFGLGNYPTREKAIKILCDGFMTPYRRAGLGFRYEYEISELSDACDVATQCNQRLITLSSSIASTLKGFFKENQEKPLESMT